MTKKPPNVLFLIPLIFGLREVLIFSIRWQHEQIENSCYSTKLYLLLVPSEASKPAVSQPQNTFVKTEAIQKSSIPKDFLKPTLEFIQNSHSSDIEWTEQRDHNESKVKVRAFPRRNESLHCYPAEPNWKQHDTTQRRPTREGLLYVKTHKTASTTVQGIAVRLAMKLAERHNEVNNTNYTACKSRYEHWPAYLLEYGQRKREKSFLFAVIREPTLRAISMFFHFEVSRRKKQPTDRVFQNFLSGLPNPDDNYKGYFAWGSAYDHYLHFMSNDGFTIGSGEQSDQLRIDTVNSILDEYDFIGISERLDESLVALQMILGLKTTDLLYYSAKNQGSWDDQGFFIQPSFVSKGMKSYFNSSQWRELSRGDYLLYLAANASLDRTIESLGRTEFNSKLAQFQFAKELVATNCNNILPLYTSEGKTQETDCLYSDAGCGSKCFDRIEREYSF